MGKVMGVVNSFLTAGVILGLVVSGLLLWVVGYWGTWVLSFIILGLDIIARLVMIENLQDFKPVPSSSAASTATNTNEDISEDTALLADENTASTSSTSTTPKLAENNPDLSTSSAFYHTMLMNS